MPAQGPEGAGGKGRLITSGSLQGAENPQQIDPKNKISTSQRALSQQDPTTFRKQRFGDDIAFLGASRRPGGVRQRFPSTHTQRLAEGPAWPPQLPAGQCLKEKGLCKELWAWGRLHGHCALGSGGTRGGASACGQPRRPPDSCDAPVCAFHQENFLHGAPTSTLRKQRRRPPWGPATWDSHSQEDRKIAVKGICWRCRDGAWGPGKFPKPQIENKNGA